MDSLSPECFAPTTYDKLIHSILERSIVLDYARQQERVLLTRNCNEFHTLHQANSLHPGILAIYQNADGSKNMSYQNIVKAIANIQIANFTLANQFVILNQWNY
ncbi:DUF5615 family PIN-like protein [Sphaerospermopsis sp. FACHB-1194]|nr:DUF5615 family PIN-like protein [Sphaerospermopsis sp. FACHB-1194]